MTDTRALNPIDGSWRRRGVVAGFAALLAAAVGRNSLQTAHAANGDTITAGGNITESSATSLTNTGTDPAFQGMSGTGGNGTGTGVYGQTGSGYGVNGAATSGAGVFGLSQSLFGVYGYTYGTGGNAVGVYGVANSGEGLVGISQTGIAVHAYAGQSSATAGRFDGPVVVNGSFSATGIKSAIVPGPDGDLRRLYCLESPESYFEDFGRAQLTRGSVHVPLDPEFASIVHSGDYDVFITEYGDSAGLFVASRGPQGFQVRERGGGTSTLQFGYRVVARRKDVVAPRLERTSIPKAVPPRHDLQLHPLAGS